MYWIWLVILEYPKPLPTIYIYYLYSAIIIHFGFDPKLKLQNCRKQCINLLLFIDEYFLTCARAIRHHKIDMWYKCWHSVFILSTIFMYYLYAWIVFHVASWHVILILPPLFLWHVILILPPLFLWHVMLILPPLKKPSPNLEIKSWRASILLKGPTQKNTRTKN